MANTSGAVQGQVDVFSLTGTGTQFAASSLPAPGSDFAIVNLRAVGVRLACSAVSGNTCTSYAVQFAINTFGQRAHPDVPAEFDVHLDVNNDGIDDYIAFNEDIGVATSNVFSGQNGVYVYNVATNSTSGPYAYTDADLNTANAVYTIPLSALTTTAKPSLLIGSTFKYAVYAFDYFFSGSLTDAITGMQYELDAPRFARTLPRSPFRPAVPHS